MISDFHNGLEVVEEEIPDTILVLDTETTGLKGARYDDDPFVDPFFKRSALEFFDESRLDKLDWSKYGDLVVDVGITEVSLREHTVKEVYSAIVGYDVSTWTEEMKTSWIFENTDLTV